MCEWGNTEEVKVVVSADLSCTNGEKEKNCKIDSCIASIVDALARANIRTRGCCCGHGRYVGDIHLEDGRVLLILNNGYDWVVRAGGWRYKIVNWLLKPFVMLESK